MPLILALALATGCLKPNDADDDSGSIGPDIDVSPEALEFGEVNQLSESTAQFTITNLGDEDLTGTLALDGAGPFEISTNMLSLGTGASMTVDVTLTATDHGSFANGVTIESNDPDESLVRVSLSATVLEDNDGDGFGPDEDCDDDDANAYPGNTEIWYDGVDGDCAGDDDFDADADTFQSDEHGGTDCDDADPDVYPGADETWYDGVDSDCDNRNDYDADEDGYASDDYGGDDCDDDDADINPGTLENQDDGLDNDCDGSVDEDLSGDDVDGDGYSELDGDCNDQDATINPGASEIWYDGTDQDCDDLSDYDADLDTEDSDAYGGVDCDDTDASVNTSAVDVPYDGVDQDCDGASDYDADLDGYDSVDYSGDDCDDLNASIHPNATEIWYDGVDQDCAQDDDYDADADTYQSDAYGGTDCDDNARNTYPGATDIWYDGVDADCGGNSDYDQDGDGEDSDTYGGVDCDDTDSDINTSADETCDGVDQDCDGTIDNDPTDGTTYYADTDTDTYGDPNNTQAACSQPTGYVSDDTDCDDNDAATHPGGTEVGYDLTDNDCDGSVDNMDAATEAINTVVGSANRQALASSLWMGADLNADGDPELIIGSPLDNYFYTDGGAAVFFDADVLGTDVSTNASYSLLAGKASGDQAGTNVLVLGDIDGDGNTELAMSAPFSGEYATTGGAVWIFDMGSGTGNDSGASAVVEEGALYGSSSGDEFGTTIAAGDMDGDGDTDLAGAAPPSSGTRGKLFVSLFSDGYSTAFDEANSFASVRLRGNGSGDYLGSAVMLDADLTGDGYGDLVACSSANNSSTGRCWLVVGSATVSYANDYIPTIDTASFTGSATGDALGAGQHTLTAFDANSDGQVDLVLGAPGYDGTTTDGGAAVIYFGGSGLSGNYAFTDADVTITGDGALGTALRGGHDVDGDSVEDLLLGAPTGGDSAQGVAYFISGGLSSSATLALPGDETASWAGDTADDLFGSAISPLFDIDGDGTDDLAISAPGNDDAGNNTGKVYVLPAY
ncbi:MAG: FG-GAP repeat protein [Alphaproteobacteria bacterium]|nr:FG-GAP repeat protein [Alphaproteobacteria bacterium]